MDPVEALRRARQHKPTVVATGAGALLVVLSLAAGVGADAVALEVGAGLMLIAVVYWLEEGLRATINEQIERVDERIETLERAVADAAGEAFVKRIEEHHAELVEEFRERPSRESLEALVERLEALRVSPITNLYPTDECLLNVSYNERDQVVVKIMPNGQGSNRRNRQESTGWLRGESYETFVSNLGETWIRTGLYPGHEYFEQWSFADALATTYSEQLAKLGGRE